MKNALLLAFLAAATTAWGAAFGPNLPELMERQSLQIKQTRVPVFPRVLSEQAIMSGDARIAISVDHKGELKEWLFIGYTNREFAEAALDAIKAWEFEPLRIRGEARAAKIEINFHFEATGVVISLDMSTFVTSRFQALLGSDEGMWPRTLKELDSIPTPITARAPDYPEEMAKKGIKGEVVVEFYIDETGAPRMPAVVSAAHEDLGVFAVEAVKDWKFEAPTCRGKPVLVRAQQIFRFGI
jgi:TonB family protein